MAATFHLDFPELCTTCRIDSVNEDALLLFQILAASKYELDLWMFSMINIPVSKLQLFAKIIFRLGWGKGVWRLNAGLPLFRMH